MKRYSPSSSSAAKTARQDARAFVLRELEHQRRAGHTVSIQPGLPERLRLAGMTPVLKRAEREAVASTPPRWWQNDRSIVAIALTIILLLVALTNHGGK